MGKRRLSTDDLAAFIAGIILASRLGIATDEVEAALFVADNALCVYGWVGFGLCIHEISFLSFNTAVSYEDHDL